jgi:hypothetical protein
MANICGRLMRGKARQVIESCRHFFLLSFVMNYGRNLILVKNNRLFAEALPNRKSGGASMNGKFE